MGLLSAIRHIGASLWIQALDHHLRSQLTKFKAEPDAVEATIARLNQAIQDLEATADYLAGMNK